MQNWKSSEYVTMLSPSFQPEGTIALVIRANRLPHYALILLSVCIYFTIFRSKSNQMFDIFSRKKISAPNASLLFLIFPCNKMPALFFLLPATPSVTPFEVFLKLPASFSSYHGLKFILYRWIARPAPTPQKGQPGRGFLYFCDMNIWQSYPFLFPLLFSHRFREAVDFARRHEKE